MGEVFICKYNFFYRYDGYPVLMGICTIYFPQQSINDTAYLFALFVQERL
jgi:hypothetical protein